MIPTDRAKYYSAARHRVVRNTIEGYMAKPLPLKLGIEPLVEATCELRVKPSIPLHTVLPGYLFTKLIPADLGKLEQLAPAGIPASVRAQEPTLASAHLMRLEWKGHYVHFGETGIAITSMTPYPGWDFFKVDVANLFDTVLTSGFVQTVERYSTKYVNLFDGQGGIRPHAAFDLSLGIGSFKLTDEICQLRVEVHGGEFLNILTIASSAVVVQPVLGQRAGAIVDVDSICQLQSADVETFRSELISRLDALKIHNKTAFFDILTHETIEALMPTYE